MSQVLILLLSTASLPPWYRPPPPPPWTAAPSHPFSTSYSTPSVYSPQSQGGIFLERKSHYTIPLIKTLQLSRLVTETQTHPDSPAYTGALSPLLPHDPWALTTQRSGRVSFCICFWMPFSQLHHHLPGKFLLTFYLGLMFKLQKSCNTEIYISFPHTFVHAFISISRNDFSDPNPILKSSFLLFSVLCFCCCCFIFFCSLL